MFDSGNWTQHNPVQIVCAPLDALAHHVSSRHVLIVTTPGFLRRGVIQRVREILVSHKVTVWEGVKPNPDMQDLDTATQALRALGIECVVGLGGGSAMDSAKILASTLPSTAGPTLCQTFRDGLATHWAPRLPLIAIPTTSGTGAEVTPFATLWDHEAHKKHSLAGNFVFPDVALLDATLTLTLGEEDTLYPALDTISHALESLWNKNGTPVSQALALQSLALSNVALPLVMREPLNLEARRNLQNASALAGLAISQTKTALAHAISYPITSHLGVPHGLACSFMLPQLLQKCLPEMVEDGLNETLLTRSLELLQGLRLQDRMAKLVSPGAVHALQHAMVTKGRSENFRYSHQCDLGLMISSSLTRGRQ